MSQELLRDIKITHVLDCIADSTKIRAVAEFEKGTLACRFSRVTMRKV